MYFLKTGIDYKDNLDESYTLQEELQLILDDGYIIKVPEGFTWNGASIPRFAWRVCGSPMVPKNVRASCIHDWLYCRKRTPMKTFSREEADILFYRILRLDKKNWVIAKLMFYTVRLLGWKFFKK